MSWSIEDYAAGVKTRFSVPVVTPDRTDFPPVRTSHTGGPDNEKQAFITRPCIILDKHDRILVWYLPAALSPKRAVRLPPSE